MHKGKADNCGETIWYIQYNTIQNTVILACTYVYMYVYIYIYVCVCVYIYIYMYIHIFLFHYRLGSLKQLAFQVVDVEVGGPTSISQTPKNSTPQ